MVNHHDRLDELNIIKKKITELDSDSSFHAITEAIQLIEKRIEEVEKDKSYANPLWPKGSNPYQ